MRLKSKGLAGTKAVLDASQNEKASYETTVAGRTFIVHPNVFSPRYFFDTELFARTVTVASGESLLEIGPGTGAISVTKALEGAGKVVAVDINPSAVANARENARRHQVEGVVTIHKGNVYSPLTADDQFDIIFWNVPFGLVPKEISITTLERAVYDPGYQAIERFVRGAKQHLKPGGRLLIGFSTTLGHWSLIETMLREEGYKVRLVAEEWSTETHPVKFNLFEARMK